MTSGDMWTTRKTHICVTRWCQAGTVSSSTALQPPCLHTVHRYVHVTCTGMRVHAGTATTRIKELNRWTVKRDEKYFSSAQIARSISLRWCRSDWWLDLSQMTRSDQSLFTSRPIDIIWTPHCFGRVDGVCCFWTRLPIKFCWWWLCRCNLYLFRY